MSENEVNTEAERQEIEITCSIAALEVHLYPALLGFNCSNLFLLFSKTV